MSDFSNTSVFVSPTAMEMSSLQKYQVTLWGIHFSLPVQQNLSLVHANCVHSATRHKLCWEWLFEHGENKITITYTLIAPSPNPQEHDFCFFVCECFSI